jgi:hypothetical protein
MFGPDGSIFQPASVGRGNGTESAPQGHDPQNQPKDPGPMPGASPQALQQLFQPGQGNTPKPDGGPGGDTAGQTGTGTQPGQGLTPTEQAAAEKLRQQVQRIQTRKDLKPSPTQPNSSRPEAAPLRRDW